MSVSSEIRKLVEGKEGMNYTLASGLIDRLEALEKYIADTEKVPHFRTHPSDPTRQKITMAGKLYKEYSASYRDTIIKLYKLLCDGETEEGASPLREFLNGLEIR